MNTTEIIAVGSLFLAFVSLITGYLLQRDAKKVRDMERELNKSQGRLVKAVKAIQGYQLIEKDYANELGKETSSYRREIRKDYSDYFNTAFLSPKNVSALVDEIERA